MSKSILLLAIGIILLMLKFLADFLAHALTQDKENRVRAELESWRKIATESSQQSVFSPLFQIPARALAGIFGPRALSWRSLRSSASITSLLLVICFALAVVFNGFNPPEKLFSQSIELLKKHAVEFGKLPGDYSQFRRNASDLAEMTRPLYGVLYTAYFFLVTFGVTALFSFLTLAFSRRLLHTSTQVKDLFSLCVILVSNMVGIFFLLVLQCSALSILLFPAFWPSVPPLLQAFGQAPFVMLILTLIGGLFAPLFYWLTSASWLRIAIVLSLSPCFLVGALILLNILTRLFKRTCSGYVISFLDLALRSRRGIFQFFSFCFAVAIPLCSFIVWLAQLKLVPLLVGSLFALSLIMTLRVTSLQRSLITAFTRSTCLFAGCMAAVIVGYYSQAIIECFRNPTSAPKSLTDPFFSSLVPGAWAALWVVYVKLTNRSILRLSLGFLAITMLVDFWRALKGAIAFSDFAMSVPFNIVGAAIGAWAILVMDKFLFPDKTSAPISEQPAVVS